MKITNKQQKEIVFDGEKLMFAMAKDLKEGKASFEDILEILSAFKECGAKFFSNTLSKTKHLKKHV